MGLVYVIHERRLTQQCIYFTTVPKCGIEKRHERLHRESDSVYFRRGLCFDAVARLQSRTRFTNRNVRFSVVLTRTFEDGTSAPTFAYRAFMAPSENNLLPFLPCLFVCPSPSFSISEAAPLSESHARALSCSS